MRPLDYFADLLSRIRVTDFDYLAISNQGWHLSDALAEAKNRFQRVTIDAPAESISESDADLIETDEQVLGWIVASLSFDFLSHKQLRAIVTRVYESLIASHLDGAVKGKLALVKFIVRNRIEEFIKEQVDIATERAFGELFESGKVFFYLESKDCNFKIPDFIRIEAVGKVQRLNHDDGRLTTRTLFDFEPDHEVNQFERQIALVLDEEADVLWWYRNRVGRDQFTVQGYRKNRIYPDFLVQADSSGRKHHRVLVLEGKGEHLSGHPDTMYKRKVADYFEKAGRRVTWQELGSEFKNHVFRFQILDAAQPHGREWKDKLRELLSE